MLPNPNEQNIQPSPYAFIYDIVVPKDNMLRKIKELVDFSFVLDELRHTYCHDNGRTAISPTRMFKYLFLKCMFDLSDVDIVERSMYDMSFKYFLDMAPEETVINPSSLTKFRKLRLKDEGLLDVLITKTVEIAKEHHLIRSTSIIVDATHTKARFNQKSPKEFLREKAKLLRKAVYEVDATMRDKFPQKPETEEISDELTYCQTVVETVETEEALCQYPKIKEKLNYMKELVTDYQEQLYLSEDSDARVGHKTADSSFFGYKTHLAMNEERIVTAAVVTTGEKSDGKFLQTLIEKSQKAGMTVETIIGDAAYSERNNIQYTKQNEMQLVSKLNPVLTQGTRKKEDEFAFNKDANMYVCPAGHMAVRRARTGTKKKNKNQKYTYYFNVETCKVCPLRTGCYKEGAKSKTYSVTIKSEEHKDQQAFQESEVFKEKAKERYKIEAKHSEMKHRHGYDVANSTGLLGMQLQGAMTLFTINIKRILTLLKEKE